MAAKAKFKILNDLKVSNPCVAADFSAVSEPRSNGWFCSECQKPVHDLARLSKAEIVKLIEETGGHFCASIRRRADGSIITNEPPSRSYFSAGVFLAGTALLASSAAAQEAPVNPGQIVAPQPETNTGTAVRGEIAPIDSIVPDCSAPSNTETNNPNDQNPAPDPTPNNGVSLPDNMEVGLVAVEPEPTPPTHTRGKVLIKKINPK